MAKILVIANVTATSGELIDTLKQRAREETCRFTLVVPPKPDTDSDTAQARLEEATERMRAAGLEMDAGRVGASDPVLAATHAWGPDGFDEIVISTLPPDRSKWLEHDVPARLEAEASVPVTHVVATGSDRVTYQAT